MDKEKIGKMFGSIFEALASAEKDETDKEFGVVIQELVNLDLKDMEDYDAWINYKLSNILERVIDGINSDIEDADKLYKLYPLYKNYQFIDNNLLYFIKGIEGSCCSADKTRWLIQSYREYILTGAIPNMTIEERCYWKPKFGTGEQWMELCEGIVGLLYGEPKKYFDSMKELFKEE
jgi:hypothetical protein